ncbi:MAG: DCC1-like thiol-disulfide oxidoreductase family protein [Leptospiraceae bacterium]|nr:DCC1-like thiol-disulfide oxidoreductase family protein [Leptospiraceae bacterium]
MKPKIFFYDGDCEFCTSLANFLEKQIKLNVEFKSFRDFEEDELLKIHPELFLSKLESEVQLITNDRRYPGFFAIRELSWNLKFGFLFAPILYLPLIPFLGMFVMYILKQKKISSGK